MFVDRDRLIALDQTAALVVECKWSSRPVGIDILRQLEHQAARIPELEPLPLTYGLCARSGFTEAVQASAAERSDPLLFDLARIAGA
jgi:hypothetical protein